MNASDPSVRRDPSRSDPGPRSALVAAMLVGALGACAHRAPHAVRPSLPPGALAGVEEVTVVAAAPTEILLHGTLPLPAGARPDDHGSATKLREGFVTSLRDEVVAEARRAGASNVRVGLDVAAGDAALARGANVSVDVTWATFVEAPGKDPFLALALDFEVRVNPSAASAKGTGEPAETVQSFTLVDLEPRAASAWAADGGRAIAEAEARLLGRAARRIASALFVGAGTKPAAAAEAAAEEPPPADVRDPAGAPGARGVPRGEGSAVAIEVSSSYEMVGAGEPRRARGLGPGGGALAGLGYGAAAGVQAAVGCTVFFPICVVLFVPAGAAVGTVVGALVGGISAATRGASHAPDAQGTNALAPDPARSGLRRSLHRISSAPAFAARIQAAASASAEAGTPAIDVTVVSARLVGLAGPQHPALPRLTVTGRGGGASREERTVEVTALGPLAAHLWLEEDGVLLRAALEEAAGRSGAELARAFAELPPPAPPPPAEAGADGGAVWRSGFGPVLQ